MERRLIPAGSGSVAVAYHAPAAEIAGLPLLVALHGGTYTSEYFSVAGGPSGSFLDIAGRNGFAVLTVDRPGYGESTLLAEEENTFARQAEILDGVIAEALAVWPATGVVLVAHSIGGMISLEIAARHPRWPLLGVTIIHRFGTLAPGAPIVLVVTASAHRGPAFAAAEFLMDYLKARAPFWKRAHRSDGVVEDWIEAKPADADAAARWRAAD